MSQPTGPTNLSNLELGPPGVGTSAAGHAEAMERRRRRLAEAAGLDPGVRKQAEIDLPADWWRPVRWTVETRWKKSIARTLCPDDNPWYGHPAFLHCTTEAVARNACSVLRRQFPGKSYRYRPSCWVDAKGNRFPLSS